jgi:hypothetical protein
MYNKAAMEIKVFWDMMLCGLVSLLMFWQSALPPYIGECMYYGLKTMKTEVATPPKRQDNTVTSQTVTGKGKGKVHPRKGHEGPEGK